MEKFEGGAIRSVDAKEERYDLISPIALHAVALEASQYDLKEVTKNTLINESVHLCYEFLKGTKDTKLLAKAALFVMATYDTTDKNPFIIKKEKGIYYDYLNIPPNGLSALARRHKLGADHYGEFNWERGMPISDLMNHLLRHFRLYFKEGNEKDDNLGGVIWGLFACIHSYILWPERNLLLRNQGCKLSPAIIFNLEERNEIFKKSEGS